MAEKDVNGQVRESTIEDRIDEEAPASLEVDSTGEEPEEQADPGAKVAIANIEIGLELQKIRDQLLRQAAEYQNYRRRTDKERAEWARRARITVIDAMLTVLDDFRRSLDAAELLEQTETPGPTYQALKDGVGLVYKNFADALEKFGVEVMEAKGEPFDENLHEALMQVPAPDDVEPGVVVEEIQRGYRLGDLVLRHAKVIVAA